MTVRQFRQMLLLVIISVVLLSLTWEFIFSGIVLEILIPSYQHETGPASWASVFLISLFVTLSLIYPYITGIRLIEKRSRLVEEVKRLSEEDHLTGLYNRRKINKVVEDEVIRCQRYGGGFAVILCDLDHFKNVNDQYTHMIGDQVLQKVSECIQNKLRKSDSAGRWGGEEFLIFCPSTRSKGAVALAEKLRVSIETMKIDIVGSITCSFGVAIYTKESDLESLLNNADNALYHAKHHGRNRVDVSSV